MVESAMLWYPNRPQKGCHLMIGLDDDRVFSMHDFTGEKITFEATAGQTVRFIKLLVEKGHSLNGVLLTPILHKKNSSTNLISWPFASRSKVSTWDGHTWFNNAKASFQYFQTPKGDYGVLMWVFEQSWGRIGGWFSKMRTSGVALDVEYYFVDEDSALTIPETGIYELENHSYNSHHWDVCFSTFTYGNGNIYHGRTQWPKYCQKLYSEDEGGVIWEKKLSEERCMFGGNSAGSNTYTITKDFDVVYQKPPTIHPKDDPTRNLDNFGGYCGQTKDYFIRWDISPQGTTKSGAFWFVSKNLKDWVFTESPSRFNFMIGNCSFSRNKNKGVAIANDKSRLYLINIKSDGHVEVNEAPVPANFDRLVIGTNGGSAARDSGHLIYQAIENHPDNYADTATQKYFYGINENGQMYCTYLVRKFVSVSGHPVTGWCSGFKEDAAYSTYRISVDGVSRNYVDVTFSTDGFEHSNSVSSLEYPGYTFYSIYDVPKYGIRLAFYRQDLELQKRVYDVYGKDPRTPGGNLNMLGRNVERDISVRLVGYDCDNNWPGKYKNNGWHTFTWLPNYNATGTSVIQYRYSLYTKGNGPAPIEWYMSNGPGYTNASSYIIIPYDEIGRPNPTAACPGFAFVPHANMYLEDCNHPGKHFTTRLYWVEGLND